MVGEMRDLETVATVITAAETGHLVFSTLHTNSAPQTIDRILDNFPAVQQKQILMQLSQLLKGVVSIQLVERADGTGRIAALEIMKVSPQIEQIIERDSRRDRELRFSSAHADDEPIADGAARSRCDHVRRSAPQVLRSRRSFVETAKDVP
jgi:Tfp pilus assembly pilus retraction ATPase PilT